MNSNKKQVTIILLMLTVPQESLLVYIIINLAWMGLHVRTIPIIKADEGVIERLKVGCISFIYVAVPHTQLTY